MWAREKLRRLEIRAVKLQRPGSLLWRNEVRERVGKTQFCGDGRTPRTRSQQPDLGCPRHIRRNLNAGKGMFGWKTMMKKRHQLNQLLFKIVILNSIIAV